MRGFSLVLMLCGGCSTADPDPTHLQVASLTERRDGEQVCPEGWERLGGMSELLCASDQLGAVAYLHWTRDGDGIHDLYPHGLTGCPRGWTSLGYSIGEYAEACGSTEHGAVVVLDSDLAGREAESAGSPGRLCPRGWEYLGQFGQGVVCANPRGGVVSELVDVDCPDEHEALGFRRLLVSGDEARVCFLEGSRNVVGRFDDVVGDEACPEGWTVLDGSSCMGPPGLLAILDGADGQWASEAGGAVCPDGFVFLGSDELTNALCYEPEGVP